MNQKILVIDEEGNLTLNQKIKRSKGTLEIEKLFFMLKI